VTEQYGRDGEVEREGRGVKTLWQEAI